jgi:hypothetical protein
MTTHLTYLVQNPFGRNKTNFIYRFWFWVLHKCKCGYGTTDPSADPSATRSTISVQVEIGASPEYTY